VHFCLRSALVLALVHIGFAIGAIMGAAIGAAVIDEYGWRAIFLSAAILGSITTIACYVALPESVNFLIARQPPNAHWLESTSSASASVKRR
jgi:predicted MFS family arabinose efflux permease